MSKSFGCIVIGGGHAGAEAAHAAARMGLRTALVTMQKDKICEMSCNPAIGGIAKGQIVREIDALGGLMALAADATGIQFKMLNRRRGPAVHSPRAQSDRHRYQDWMERYLEQVDGLDIIESSALDIVVEEGAVAGVVCSDGHFYPASTVVVATGTFLRGQMYIGDHWWDGGRISEPASEDLSGSLKRMGLEVDRLATGTPPRLDASTVDFEKMEEQAGDDEPVPFSFMNDRIEGRQVSCWVTYTNEAIHQLLRDNLHRAPISLGQIKGTKPRYCPSIEAKMIAYPDKVRHRIFLEPEEQAVKTIYCNGLFTSVPKDVQDEMLRLLPGTENAKILQYGYGVEYDYCRPNQLRQTLETKKISGLFLAGQINATSGYEEAAGQGLVAGMNAALKVQGKEPVKLGRDQAYIGVLIDDLLTKGIDEPYRMFTSRAEYRLSLRSDNADRRLTGIGRDAGLVDDARWERFSGKMERVERFKNFLKSSRRGGVTYWDLCGRPDSDIGAEIPGMAEVREMGLSAGEIETVLVDAKYSGYLEKQDRMVAGFARLESKRLPERIDFSIVEHLRREAKQKLEQFRPETLGQALRISGITPADITVLQIHMKKNGYA